MFYPETVGFAIFLKPEFLAVSTASEHARPMQEKIGYFGKKDSAVFVGSYSKY